MVQEGVVFGTNTITVRTDDLTPAESGSVQRSVELAREINNRDGLLITVTTLFLLIALVIAFFAALLTDMSKTDILAPSDSGNVFWRTLLVTGIFAISGILIFVPRIIQRTAKLALQLLTEMISSKRCENFVTSCTRYSKFLERQINKAKKNAPVLHV